MQRPTCDGSLVVKSINAGNDASFPRHSHHAATKSPPSRRACPSHFIVVEVEIDIPWSLCVAPYEFFVSRRPLGQRVAGEHALQAHAHALHVMHRTPALPVQQVQTNDAVAVDVRVQWDADVLRRHRNERDFRRFCRTRVSETNGEMRRPYR